MATVVPSRRRSSLLKGLRRQGSTSESTSAATAAAAAEKGEGSSSPVAQEPAPTPAPAVRKTHEQLAQYRADFFKRVQASLEEATAIGSRADVLVEHQRVQVCTGMLVYECMYMQASDRGINRIDQSNRWGTN